MKLVEKYSHLNGYEWIQYNHPSYWKEIEDVIKHVDAKNLKTKISEEKTMKGKMLYSPTEMNKAFKREFEKRGWVNPKKENFKYIKDQKILREIINKDIKEQEKIISKEGIESLPGFVESDFAKDRISIEVQFGKYAFVQYDIYVKFTPQYNDNIIDLGVEIVPMKSLEKEMSSGPTNYERNLHEIFRQGRTSPPIPIILIGIDA
tara:strand:+ start:1793 stop:2407 length:615 start_codon:yes stop_codon:yes gene_type:complete